MLDDFSVATAYLGAGGYVVTVVGELDVATAPALRTAFAELAHEGALEVIVDLLNMPFIDSVGLAVLVETSKRLKAKGGVLRVVCNDGRVAHILEITGLGQIVALYPTLREALESLASTQRAAVATGA
jgi:anti-sigma B factor antagonist